ncbi:MAG: ABC transporter permease [Vicinamibacterales bacterium]
MFAAIRTRVRSLLQRRRVSREMDDELRFHLEMETAANVGLGMAPHEARRAALRDLGGIDQTKEAIRDVRATWIESVWLDIRQAVRALRARPAAVATAAVMLALGIGLTTAMFTIADALLLRPVPFHAPDELALVYMGNEHGGRHTVSPTVLRVWRESGAFAGVEAAVPDTALVELDGRIATRGIARVTPGLFRLLGGVRPVRGRLFDASDAHAGTDDRVLVSEDLWRTLFAADPALVGRRITIDGESLHVIGVLPADFRFPAWNTVIWRATDFEARAAAAGRDGYPVAYVRFASHIPRSDALRLAMDDARAADSSNAELWPRVNPLAGMVLDPYYQRAVPMLAGGVVLVFLVLCANVCSLLLARLSARRREFSMRSALGASRGRLVRQALVESSLIGALGVLAAIGFAWALVSMSRTFLPEAFLLRTLNPLNLDLRALAVTSIAGGVATLAAGLLPAWIATRVDVTDSLRVTDRAGTEARGARVLTRSLLVAEIALACPLLVGTALLVRSFVKMTGAERGLNVEGVMTATMSLRTIDFPDRASRRETARVIDEHVRQLPGVQQVAWSYGLPPDGGAISFGNWRADVPGSPALDLVVERYNVGPEFFALYGIPLLRGRPFQASDLKREVLIGQRLGSALWPGMDPVGRSFRFEDGQPFTVIGLVREIHYPSLDKTRDRPEFYEVFGGVGDYAMMSVRCDRACPDEAMVRKQIVAAHGGVRIVEVRPLEDIYFEQLARPRAAAALGLVFAGIALLASAGGLFSVLSYAVGRRRREFGIRTAIGASPSAIGRLVLRDGLSVALAGLLVGCVAAWSAGRALASLQYGVTVSDPVSWAFVLALLGATTALATWQPAREAMRVDPVRLLREE